MQIKFLFPHLTPANHRLTSPVDLSYNCVAWAMERCDTWLQPHLPYLWPGDYLPTTDEPSVQDIAGVFIASGFEVCGSPLQEDGYDRVALYAIRDCFTHVCRQIDDGWWASKIGGLQDIEHVTLGVLEGEAYGSVSLILRRSKLWATKTTPET